MEFKLDLEKKVSVNGKPALDPDGPERPGMGEEGDWLLEEGDQMQLPEGGRNIILPAELGDPAGFRQKAEPHQPPSPGTLDPFWALAAVAGLAGIGYGFYRLYVTASFTLAPVIGLLLATLIPLGTLVALAERRQRRSLYPVLKQLAAGRPGAFVTLDGGLPIICYARERWLGRSYALPGGKSQSPLSVLAARVAATPVELEINKRSAFDKVFGKEKTVELPALGDFDRKFAVWCSDGDYARRLLTPAVAEVVVGLSGIGGLTVRLHKSMASVRVRRHLFQSGEAKRLGLFLALAEGVVGAIAGEGMAIPRDATAAAGAGGSRMKKAALVLVVLALAVLAGLNFAEWRFERELSARAAELERAAGRQAAAPVEERELAALPPAARGYLRFAGAVGKPRISVSRWAFRGQNRNPGCPWRPCRGEYTVTTRKLSVSWYGANKPRWWISVASAGWYFDGAGRAVTKGHSLFVLRDVSGSQAAPDTFNPLLTQLVMFPTLLLDGGKVVVRAAGRDALALTVRDGKLSCSGTLYLNSDGSPARLEMMRRRGGKDKRAEKWTGYYGECREAGGYRLPGSFRAVWGEGEKAFEYMKYEMREVEIE